MQNLCDADLLCDQRTPSPTAPISGSVQIVPEGLIAFGLRSHELCDPAHERQTDVRLFYEVRCPIAHCTHRRGNIRFTAQHDHRQSGLTFAQLSEQLKPREARQLGCSDNATSRSGADALQVCLSGVVNAHIDTKCFQQFAHCGGDCYVGIYNRNAMAPRSKLP
jgi:hypothetical protein